MPDPQLQPITLQTILQHFACNWRTTVAGLCLTVLQIEADIEAAPKHNKLMITAAVATAILGVVSRDPRREKIAPSE